MVRFCGDSKVRGSVSEAEKTLPRVQVVFCSQIRNSAGPC